ncbi:hypothetical protein PTKIN_Ptkin19aG0132700 [Pterospermum kingtungense]
MEVMVGPTFGIEIASSADDYVRDRPQDKISSSPCCLFAVGGHNPILTLGSDRGSPDVSSESSSSIGDLGDSDDDQEDEVSSSGGTLRLPSLACLEESLPIKRGLSNHYAGKSKSFVNLSDVISSVKDLQKTENPFNKRRRVLIANKLKWSRKSSSSSSSSSSSFYSWQNPNSMPLLAFNEDGDDKQTPSSSSSSSNDNMLVVAAAAATKPKLRQTTLMATSKSHSCFSLTDLPVEH